MSNRNTFYNPYYFVWFVDRAQVKDDPELGDRPPRGIDRLAGNQVRGVIRVEMTAVTDLLVPDHSRATRKGEHKSLPVRLVNGKPHLAPTSVKGMIRSVFETVTLSRMGVFRPAEVTRKVPRGAGRSRARKDPFSVQPPALAAADRVQPAAKPDEMSMADRVFGWVSDAGSGAFAGRVRIGRVEPVGEVRPKAVRYTLALSSPRPEYARFYTRHRDGWASKPRSEIGYDVPDARLAGRKVYPHHQDVKEQARRAEESASTVTFDSVIPAGSVFEFEVRFEGLSRAEAGALIWSIEPGDPDFHHRLGGGKPYGFGSVKLSRQSVVVESGHEVADRYRTGSASAGITYDDLISAFREVFEQATGTSFETHPTVRAILVAGRGLWNISYPRTLEQMAEGRFDESFRWFVSNEKKEIPGSFQSLPQLDEEMPGLRALPDRAPKTTGQGGKGRGSGQGGRPPGGKNGRGSRRRRRGR